jgi:S-formylglutathione hydrolase FrmB
MTSIGRRAAAPRTAVRGVADSLVRHAPMLTSRTAMLVGVLSVLDLLHPLIANFPASANAQQWSVAGLSGGATCAVTDDPAGTTADLFHGSSAAYAAHDPTHLLNANRSPTLSGWFEAGESDTATLRAENELVLLARTAAIDVHASQDPGGHERSMWINSVHDMLPWLWTKVVV